MPSRKKPGTGLIPACSRSASSASWLFMCVFRLYSCAKRLSHPGYVHAYGRSPVCVRVCERRLKSSEKRLPQPSNGQRYGRSPVCVRECRFSFELSRNRLPQP